MTNASNLPAPYLGMDQTTPLAALQSPFCQTLFNFNVVQDGIVLRNGDSKYEIIAHTAASNLTPGILLAPYGNTYLFMPTINGVSLLVQIYDVDAGTISYTSGVAANAGDIFTYSFFNNYLYIWAANSSLLSPVAPGYAFNGTAWGVTGYTGTGTFNPFGGCGYKNRNYLVQYGEAAYWYSEIDAVTGATTKVDLSGLVSQKCTLSIIAPITLADSVQAVTLLAFVFDNGEILFYDGSYPDSETWQLVGRAQTGQLTSLNPLPYQGDTIILCDNGIVSLRDLFLQGSEKAINLSVNTRIQKSWDSLIQAIRTTYPTANGPLRAWGWPGTVRGVWEPKTNRLIIMVPMYLNSSGTLVREGATYFVFNTLLKSWFIQRSFGASGTVIPFGDIATYKNKVLTLCSSTTNNMIYQKEGATGFTDRNTNDSAEVEYTFDFISAPIPFPKTENYETTQIEPIIESDLYATTNWYLVADFGRQTTNAQTTDALTTAPAKPAVNVGMQNVTFVQVQMAGTTAASKTVGLTLYSYNVWYNRGEVASR